MIELGIFYFIMGMVLAFTFAKTEHGFMAWVILWPLLIGGLMVIYALGVIAWIGYNVVRVAKR